MLNKDTATQAYYRADIVPKYSQNINTAFTTENGKEGARL